MNALIQWLNRWFVGGTYIRILPGVVTGQQWIRVIEVSTDGIPGPRMFCWEEGGVPFSEHASFIEHIVTYS